MRMLMLMKLFAAAILSFATLAPAVAQDIRGLEVCTAEKSMERRTGCMQANIEFLQQALAKLARETNAKMTATNGDLAAARADIAALKSALAKLDGELALLRAAPKSEKKQ
jgi:hypothetical protein